MKNSTGFAEKFIRGIGDAGGYIHHAVFVTLKKTSGVYDWVCVESGVSLKAFKIRFLNAMKEDQKEEIRAV